MVTKFFLIFLIIVLSATFVEAIEFSLSAPDSVSAGEEFSVQLNTEAEVSEDYDVKIFVYKSTKEYSEIYNNGWKSPFNYLLASFPEENEFKIRAHYIGETELCARLRPSADKNAKVSEQCIPITITETEEEIEQEDDEEESQEKNLPAKNSPDSEADQNAISGTKEKISQQISVESQPEDSPQKIILANPSKLSDPPATLYSKQEKIRLGITIGFVILCVISIILLALKRL